MEHGQGGKSRQGKKLKLGSQEEPLKELRGLIGEDSEVMVLGMLYTAKGLFKSRGRRQSLGGPRRQHCDLGQKHEEMKFNAIQERPLFELGLS